MEPASVESRATDKRGAARSSIYLAATLYSDGASSPVKIRNMSVSGAHVEIEVPPAVGSIVQLVRGELIVHALVAWSDEDRCGLKFSGRVDVQRWRAPPGNREQQRVDEVVRLVKAGVVPLPIPPLADGAGQEQAEPDAQLPGDLRLASELLDKLGEALAGDPDMVAQHGPALQNIDIAIQLIAAVRAALECDPGCEPDATKLQGLRRSADQALKRG